MLCQQEWWSKDVSTGRFLFIYGEQRMKHSELDFGYGSASFIDAESALIFFVGGLFL
jgi:hypothetical protein